VNFKDFKALWMKIHYCIFKENWIITQMSKETDLYEADRRHFVSSGNSLW